MPHFNLQPCNYDKWLRFDSWPVQQAAFILLGYEPPSLDYLMPRRRMYASADGPSYTFDEPAKYRQLLDLMWNSIANGNLATADITVYHGATQQVRPVALVEWASKKSITLPREFHDKVALVTTTADTHIGARTDSEDLGERQRSSAEKIIAGLLIHSFTDAELSEPYAVAAEIERSLQSSGLALSKQTIVKWVQAATDLMPLVKKTK